MYFPACHFLGLVLKAVDDWLAGQGTLVNIADTNSRACMVASLAGTSAGYAAYHVAKAAELLAPQMQIVDTVFMRNDAANALLYAASAVARATIEYTGEKDYEAKYSELLVETLAQQADLVRRMIPWEKVAGWLAQQNVATSVVSSTVSKLFLSRWTKLHMHKILFDK